MDDYPNQSPNEAWAPEKPKDRQEQETKERTKVTTSIGVIEDVIKWFDTNADQYGSIDALNIDEKTEPTAALIAMNTAKKLREAFKAKSAIFRAEFSKYLKEEPTDPA